MVLDVPEPPGGEQRVPGEEEEEGCRGVPAGGRVGPAAGCLPPAQTGFWKVLCLAGCILGRVMWSPVMSWDQSLTQLRGRWMGVRRYRSAG